MLRNAASLTLVDELGTQPQLVLLAVLLFLCLLRGVTERREWRIVGRALHRRRLGPGVWGLPTTPAGEVSRWDTARAARARRRPAHPAACRQAHAADAPPRPFY